MRWFTRDQIGAALAGEGEPPAPRAGIDRPPSHRGLAVRRARERALEGLDEQQREAATTLRGPVVVLAGAGTGKTRVITRRIAHGVDTGAYSPGRVMARHLHGEGGGRDALAPAFPRRGRAWRRAPSTRPRSRSSTTSGRLSRAIRCPASSTTRCASSRTPPTRWESSRTPRPFATSRAGSSGARSRSAASRRTPLSGRRGSGGSRSGGSRSFTRAYEKLKDERRQLDFEDVLLACAGMLEAEPQVTRAVREQYRHFTVDEFQDVSPLQHRLLDLWLGDRRDICVVGDASQTIYSFAGADARFLLEFGQRHEGTRCPPGEEPSIRCRRS